MKDWVCSVCGAPADYHVNTKDDDMFYCKQCWQDMIYLEGMEAKEDRDAN